MMKKINLILFALLAVVVSCENAYEFDRDFIIPADGAINNLDDAERLVAGAYESTPYASVIQFNAYASDNLQIGDGNRGQGIQEHTFQLDSTDGLPTGLWSAAYNVIDVVNRVIIQIEAVAQPGEETRRDQLLSECYALRAWMHFELFRGFTPEYDNPSSPSAIVIDRVVIFDQNNVEYLPRSTGGEMLTQVNADLSLARSLADPAATDKYRFNTTTINAMQARVGLYENTTASLTNAAALASQVINTIPISGQAEYDALFRQDDLTGELIFSIEKDANDGAIGTLFTDTNDDIFFDVSDDLVFNPGGILTTSNSDVRFGILLDFETAITAPSVAPPILPVGKYIGRTAANPAIHDHKILRTSEMYLIRAEAAVRSNAANALSTAAADVALVRAARGSAVGTPATYADANAALADIAVERRLELAFEGHRVYDLKRTNTDITRDPSDCTGSTPCTLAISSGRFTFPVPQTEIDANNAINESDQNPGY